MNNERRKILIGLSSSLISMPTIITGQDNSWKSAEINVQDFGALGDGKTDDTKAILTASQTAFRRLYFPPGQYLFSGVPLKFKDAVIDASNAELINNSKGEPLFRVISGARVSRSQIFVKSYRSLGDAGYFLEISGGLVSDCQIEVTRVDIRSSSGGVIKHHSQQISKSFNEGLYFTNIIGSRWDKKTDGPGAPMIDILSNFNSFSACNFSVRDVRLLSQSIFLKAVCSSDRGASFSQIKLHDMSVEKCDFGFVHFIGARMAGLVNIGMFDLKEVVSPLFAFEHAPLNKNSQGCYCRDIYRSSANFSGHGCDIMATKNSVEVDNYLAVGGMVRRRP
mgnify:CR=1 FL=1